MRTIDALHAKLWRGGNPFENIPAGKTDLQGWGSQHPCFAMGVEQLKPRVVIEVGVWKSGSTIFIADKVRNLARGSREKCRERQNPIIKYAASTDVTIPPLLAIPSRGTGLLVAGALIRVGRPQGTLEFPAGVSQRDVVPVLHLQPAYFDAASDDALKFLGRSDPTPCADHQDDRHCIGWCAVSCPRALQKRVARASRSEAIGGV